MKKLSLLFFFILSLPLVRDCFAQNLVPNPSFEDTVACPNNYDEMNYATGWSAYRFTPDYFNVCNTNVVGVPSNDFGFQNPRTGNAYAGFASFDNMIFYRENIGIQLNQALIIGQQYFVSFFVSMAVNNIAQINIATNKLGARFFTVPFSFTSPVPIDNYAQVFTDSVIHDTLNWVKVSGSFVADSAYTYLSIGNFFNDSATSYFLHDISAVLAYYYIDDVCVSTDSLICSGEIIKDVTENDIEFSISIFPNPTKGKIHFINNSTYPFTLTIYSSMGHQILNDLINEKESSLDITNYSAGIYFALIKRKGNIIQKKIIKY